MRLIALLVVNLWFAVVACSAAVFTTQVVDDNCQSFEASLSATQLTLKCVQAPTQPPTDGSIADQCKAKGYAALVGSTLPAHGSGTQTTSGFHNGQAIVVPVTIKDTTGYAKMAYAESGGGAIARIASWSSKPCDWPTPTTGSSGQLTQGLSADMTGKTYYFNLKNENSDGTPSCYSGNCDVVLNYLSK